jgi:alcohol dehydrogenase class IV
VPVTMRWEDEATGRVVLVKEGLVGELPATLAEEGWDEFDLLSTERAVAGAPGIGEAAARTHVVPAGSVPEISAAILDEVSSGRLVALGGGRVIDTAKAIAAVRGGEVAAAPTTLSGAEITGIHRFPAGHEGGEGVHASLVLADPVAMTSLPEAELRATAMNALAHGADSVWTPLADGASRKLARSGAGLIAEALDAGREQRVPRDLAVGSLISAQALDAAGIALHHALTQTLVRVCGTPHAETNAAVLPVVLDEMRRRAPAEAAALADALGAEPEGIRARVEQLGGGRRGLGDLGADRACIGPAVEAAMARGDLHRMTPGEVTPEDLERLIEAAW